MSFLLKLLGSIHTEDSSTSLVALAYGTGPSKFFINFARHLQHVWIQYVGH